MKADTTKGLEQFSELGQSVLNGLIRYNEIMSSRIEQLLKLHNAVINDSLETNIKHIRALSEAKKLEDALSWQLAYFNETSRKAVDHAKKYFGLAIETNADLSRALQQNLEQLSARSTDRKAA